MTDLNRAQYSGFDFDTYNDELRARLQVKFASVFNDFAVTSLGIMLLDLTAFGLSTLSFYLDRRATDTYLATARTRKSVSRITRQLGFKMGGAVASSVDLQVSITEAQTFNVPIPAGFQFSGPNGIVFEVAQATLFTVPEQGPTRFKSVPAFEGTTLEETFVSDGSPLQVFELRRVPANTNVVEGTVTCLVDGSPFTIVDLLEAGPTDQFEVGFNDSPPTIRFGDGLAGNIPTAGASILVRYVASRGRAGQVPSNSIRAAVSPLVVSLTQIPLSVTNPEPSAGGDDPMSLGVAKALAPQVFKSRRVAVVGTDYEALAGSYADPLFGRVAVARAISSRSAASDTTVQNYLTAILLEALDVSTTLETETTAALSALDTILTQEGAITAALATSVTAGTLIDTARTTLLASARTSRNLLTEAAVDLADIQDHVLTGKAEVLASAASPSEQLAINSAFDLIAAEALAVSAAASATDSEQQTIITQAQAIEASTTTLGNLSTGSLGAIEAARVALVAAEALSRAAILVIQDSGESLVTVVQENKTLIEAHFDRILSADCSANLVTVPILVRNAGGFYAAPSTGLLASLQAFLDARKEVTQTVSVTSGVNSLVRAVIRVRLGVRQGYSEPVLRTTTETVVSGVLRDRAFGVPLYESDLDQRILVVEGSAFANVRILGHLALDGVTVLTTLLDGDQNLIIGKDQVITLGTLEVVTEVVGAS
jgi:hypothetical protein